MNIENVKSIREQHLQEQAQLAAELFHTDKRCEFLRNRLNEICCILQTVDHIAPQNPVEKDGENKDKQ